MNSNTMKAIEIVSVLIQAGMQAFTAAQKYNNAVKQARNEGRDVTDDELMAMKATSDKMTDDIMKKLGLS